MPTTPLRLVLGSALLLAMLALSGCDVNINLGEDEVVTSGSVSGKFHAEKVENLTRAIQETSVQVETRNGEVDVRQIEGAKEVTITVTIKTGGKTQETADERLGKVKTIAEEKDGTLTLRAEFPKPVYNTDAAAFKVEVPKLRDVLARTNNGAVIVHAASGVVDGTSSNGTIRITDAGSSVRAKSMNGSISITMNAAATGPIEVEAVNGSVEAEVGAGFGGTLEMSTTNGKIDFRDNNERAKKSTIRKHSGSVVLEGSGESTLKTVNGSVTVVVR